jgi:hypothetical protein
MEILQLAWPEAWVRAAPNALILIPICLALHAQATTAANNQANAAKLAGIEIIPVGVGAFFNATNLRNWGTNGKFLTLSDFLIWKPSLVTLLLDFFVCHLFRKEQWGSRQIASRGQEFLAESMLSYTWSPPMCCEL